MKNKKETKIQEEFIEPIIIIPDYTAPCPTGFVKTSYGWMPSESEIWRKINQLIDAHNRNIVSLLGKKGRKKSPKKIK